jgi:3-deoxy-7-phosphoheptulonate synthase
MTGIETWQDPPRHPAAPQPASAGGARPDADAERLRRLPPLVFAGECDRLRARLAQAARGEAFVLQGGARARTREEDTADAVRDEMRTLLQMSALLSYATSAPVVKVSRMPRVGDPQRMLSVYQASAAALNLLRAFATGGYADLREIHSWNRAFVADSPSVESYERLTAPVGRALDFMRACGTQTEDLAGTEFFASHEARLLDYDSALTRTDSRTGHRYSTAGHFVWTGGSPRGLDEAFIDYLAGIRNPIGLVLGPRTGPDEVLAALERLDPSREAGRLTFVVRMGCPAVRDTLPTLIQKVTAQGHQAAWICDAMHTGAAGTAGGQTAPRTFDDVLQEITDFLGVHRELATNPGGLHVELTGGPAPGRADPGLQRHSPPGLAGTLPSTPRLTRAGALDLAFLVADACRTAG